MQANTYLVLKKKTVKTTTLNRDLISLDSLSIHSNNIGCLTLPDTLPLNSLLVDDALNRKDRRRTTREEAVGVVGVDQTVAATEAGEDAEEGESSKLQSSPFKLHPRLAFLTLGLDDVHWSSLDVGANPGWREKKHAG